MTAITVKVDETELKAIIAKAHGADPDNVRIIHCPEVQDGPHSWAATTAAEIDTTFDALTKAQRKQRRKKVSP